MRSTLLVGFCLIAALSFGQHRLLIFSKTTGYRHASIEVAKPAIIQLLKSKGLEADTTEDATVFSDEGLSRYKAVIFLSTTGDVLNDSQQEAFIKYIKGGGGFVGIHAAADTEYEWPWYGKLVGAYFKSHPEQQTARLIVGKEKTPLKFKAPKDWSRKDEWYNYYDIAPDIHVLFYLDEKSYKGGENGDQHPIVWYHDYDGGRSFYTGMGHTNESYNDPNFMNLLWVGIQYAVEKGE